MYTSFFKGFSNQSLGFWRLGLSIFFSFLLLLDLRWTVWRKDPFFYLFLLCFYSWHSSSFPELDTYVTPSSWYWTSYANSSWFDSTREELKEPATDSRGFFLTPHHQNSFILASTDTDWNDIACGNLSGVAECFSFTSAVSTVSRYEERISVTSPRLQWQRGSVTITFHAASIKMKA